MIAIIIATMASTIGTLQESSLHAGLKAYYTLPGDQVEAKIDGFWVDIARGDQLIEIQTGNFSALKRKLPNLLAYHTVRVVFPIAVEKYIMRVARDNSEEALISRRRSPKRGKIVDLFAEMVRIPRLACSPHFSLEVVLIQEEEIWQDDGRGSWRRRGVSIIDRRLLGVLQSEIFDSPAAYGALLPSTLPQPFTVRQLASSLGIRRWLAGRMAYTLREMGVLQAVGKEGHAITYDVKVV